MGRLHWKWGVAHIEAEAEAEIGIAMGFIGYLSRLGKEL